MSDLRELYQEVILDHYKRPRNFGELSPCDHRAHGNNPLCGDKLVVYLTLEGETISQVHFQGEGCAISTASASLMTEALVGKTREEAEAIFQVFHRLVTGEPLSDAESESLGKLAIFEGVREFPLRVKCASLCWHTVRAALKNEKDAVTTE